MNTNAFDHWTNQCLNTSNVLFIKNSNVTIGNTVGNTQYVIINKNPIRDETNGYVGSNWTIQNYAE